MTTIAADPASGDALRARPAGLVHDVSAIAGRALRAVPRDLEAVIPPVFIAVFFFLVNIATLEGLTAQIPGLDYEAFQMATAILLGVTGVSRAPALVLDVQDGYLDRLLLTPVKRTAILLGHMAADVAVAAALTLPIILIGFLLGVRFEGGPLGMVVFVGLAALWSLAFAGFGYAIALKTGNPAAVNSSFLLFFPFLFLTSSYVPRERALRVARHGRHLQPGDLPPRGAAVAGDGRGLAVGRPGRGAPRHRHRRRREHDPVLRRPPRAGGAGLITAPHAALIWRGHRPHQGRRTPAPRGARREHT